MSKKLFRLLFFPFILIARCIATFVVWLMEDNTSLTQAWKEMK